MDNTNIEQRSGLSLAFVHGKGLEHLDEIEGIFHKNGFEILANKTLDTTEPIGEYLSRLDREIPDISPDRKIAVYVCFNSFPGKPGEYQSSPDTRFDDTYWELLLSKQRRYIPEWDLIPRDEPFITGTVTDKNALALLERLFPEEAGRVISLARTKRDHARIPYPALKNLSRNARRAKVYLVKYKGGKAVCKIFRDHRLGHLERELLARKIAGEKQVLAPILEQGSHHIVMPYYKDGLNQLKSRLPLAGRKKFLPLERALKIRETLLYFRRLGYELIDFNSTAVYTEEGELRISDLEFFQYCGESDTLKGCYAWYAIPEDFTGAQPLSAAQRTNPYRVYWLGWTGIPRWLMVSRAPRFLLALSRIPTACYLTTLRFIRRLRRT